MVKISNVSRVGSKSKQRKGNAGIPALDLKIITYYFFSSDFKRFQKENDYYVTKMDVTGTIKYIINVTIQIKETCEEDFKNSA